MYGLYVVILVCAVYLVPGIALIPRALFDSRIAYAIPVIGVLCVTLLARMLKVTGLFSESLVIVVTIGLLAIAVMRVLRVKSSVEVHWPEISRLVYLFSLLAALPIAVKLGLFGFQTNDEIYSWNMWAIQHGNGDPPDLHYTRAPYPQTFSLLIAWSYKLLGSIDLQLPVKAGFVVLSVSSIAAVGMASRHQTFDRFIGFVGLSIYLLYVMDVYETLSQGLAETLMIPALVVSVALYLRHSRQPEGVNYLLPAAATALLAGLSKQPALIWLMLVLPGLCVAEAVRHPKGFGYLWPVAIAWIGGLVWLLTEGYGFQNNAGVVRHAQQGRTLLEQFFFATDQHLVGKPAFVMLLLFCGYSVHRCGKGRGVFWLLVTPALLLWLMFGAYNTRLGVHVMMLAALLVASNDYCIRQCIQPLNRFGLHGTRNLVLSLGIVSIVYAMLDARKILRESAEGFSLYDGPGNVIRHYFGQDAHVVIRDIFRTDSAIWAPSAYVYGLFYHHNPVYRPDFSTGNFDAAQLREQLLKTNSKFVVDAGQLARFGRATFVLRTLVSTCADAFQPVAKPPNSYDYTIYRIDSQRLNSPDCLK